MGLDRLLIIMSISIEGKRSFPNLMENYSASTTLSIFLEREEKSPPSFMQGELRGLKEGVKRGSYVI